MVAYIRKRLNIFVCIPSGAGAEGGGVGCMVSRQPSRTCRTSPPLRAISGYAPVRAAACSIGKSVHNCISASMDL